MGAKHSIAKTCDSRVQYLAGSKINILNFETEEGQEALGYIDPVPEINNLCTVLETKCQIVSGEGPEPKFFLNGSVLTTELPKLEILNTEIVLPTEPLPVSVTPETILVDKLDPDELHPGVKNDFMSVVVPPLEVRKFLPTVESEIKQKAPVNQTGESPPGFSQVDRHQVPVLPLIPEAKFAEMLKYKAEMEEYVSTGCSFDASCAMFGSHIILEMMEKYQSHENKLQSELYILLSKASLIKDRTYDAFRYMLQAYKQYPTGVAREYLEEALANWERFLQRALEELKISRKSSQDHLEEINAGKSKELWRPVASSALASDQSKIEILERELNLLKTQNGVGGLRSQVQDMLREPYDLAASLVLELADGISLSAVKVVGLATYGRKTVSLAQGVTQQASRQIGDAESEILDTGCKLGSITSAPTSKFCTNPFPELFGSHSRSSISTQKLTRRFSHSLKIKLKQKFICKFWKRKLRAKLNSNKIYKLKLNFLNKLFKSFLINKTNWPKPKFIKTKIRNFDMSVRAPLHRQQPPRLPKRPSAPYPRFVRPPPFLSKGRLGPKSTCKRLVPFTKRGINKRAKASSKNLSWPLVFFSPRVGKILIKNDAVGYTDIPYNWKKVRYKAN